MNQKQKVVNHLRKVGDISGVEAADLYRVRDLPKRMSEILGEDLLRAGETIVKDRKRDNVGGRYMRYSLVSQVGEHGRV